MKKRIGYFLLALTLLLTNLAPTLSTVHASDLTQRETSENPENTRFSGG